MTKTAAIPIYGKNSSKILFAGSAESIATKQYVAIKTSTTLCA